MKILAPNFQPDATKATNVDVPAHVNLKGSIYTFISMSEPFITITVKLFAAYQEAYKVPELVLEIPPETTAAALLENMIAQHPELAQWRDLTRFGVNLQFVEPDTLLQDQDEVVLIPPVSGG